MEDILRAVRCHYLSPNFLKDQMKNCDLLRKVSKYLESSSLPLYFELWIPFLSSHQVPACREHLAKIFKELSLHKSPCVKQRTPSAPCILYLVAGFSRRSINLLEAFSVVDNKWIPLCPMPKSRSGLGGAFLGKYSFHIFKKNKFQTNPFTCSRKTWCWVPFQPYNIYRFEINWWLC